LSLESRRGTQLHDPGAELLDRVGGVWSEYGRVILGGVVVAVAIGAGVILFQRGQERTRAQASERLAEATVFFWQGDYARSLELARQVIQQYGSTPSGRDAHRLVADNAFWTGDYKTAIEEYRAYLSSAGDGILADAARRSLAYALETDGQDAEAATTYLGLVGKFDRESDGEMLLAAGRSHMAAGMTAEAKQDLERLVGEFGDTTSARRGRELLAQIELGLTTAP
jgi:predicted negative regulator of RcsB-dependent stress response